jgi:hypothetical protein
METLQILGNIPPPNWEVSAVTGTGDRHRLSSHHIGNTLLCKDDHWAIAKLFFR